MRIYLLHATTHTEIDYAPCPGAAQGAGASVFAGVHVEYSFEEREDCGLQVAGGIAIEPPPACQPVKLQVVGKVGGSRVHTGRTVLSREFAYWYPEVHVYLWHHTAVFDLVREGVLHWSFMVIFADGSQQAVEGSAGCYVRLKRPGLEAEEMPIGARLLAARRRLLEES